MFVMAKREKTKTTHDEELIAEVNGQMTLARRYLDQVHIRFNQIEELYRGYIDKTDYPHSARVFDPRVFRVIETITPRMVANEPQGSFYPAEQGDTATGEILKALVRYDWRRADMFPKMVEFIKWLLIFGTAFGRVYWDYREKERTQMEPKKLNGKMVWSPKNAEKVTVTEFDGPNFEVLNLYDCFPDPNATSMKNMRWFIYRTYRTLKELKAENETRGTEYYKNLDLLEESIITKGTSGIQNSIGGSSKPTDIFFREKRRIMQASEDLIGQDKSNPELVVLRRFDRDRWVDIVPGYNVVIRDVENPYFDGELPIVYCTDYPYPGDLYGLGEVEPVGRIQRAINAVLNQRLDNVQLALRNMWIVKKNAGVDMHTLYSAPGNVITTDDINAIKPFEVPDVTGSAFVQTMTYLTSAMQNGTGVTDYTVGVGDNKTVANDTATGTRLIQQEANAQFKLKIQMFNHLVIQEIANKWKNLRIQYTTEEQTLRIIGKEAVEYLRDNTKLAQTDLNGEAIAPGELEKESLLQIDESGNFAFLKLLPDKIQPSVVGDYDFIAVTSSDQLNDPITLQQNFFAALDRVTNPVWVQGLAGQGKSLNFSGLTTKVFDKLQLGIEDKDVVVDNKTAGQGMAPQQMPQSPDSQSSPMEQMMAGMGNGEMQPGGMPSGQ